MPHQPVRRCGGTISSNNSSKQIIEEAILFNDRNLKISPQLIALGYIGISFFHEVIC